MSSHSEFNPVPSLAKYLDGPGKQFPRLATLADRQSIRDAAQEFNHLCSQEARAGLKRGKVLQWGLLKVLGWLAHSSGHFVANRPVLAIDLRGRGDNLKIKLEIGERARVLASDQPRARHRSLQ